jgi:hypothetical protein
MMFLYCECPAMAFSAPARARDVQINDERYL